MAKGRGRLSWWDALPDWAEPVRVWAYAELQDIKLTQLEILDEVNNRLRAAAWAEGITTGIPVATRSSLNRQSMRLAVVGRQMREAGAMFAGLATQFDGKEVDESTRVLGQYLKTLVLEISVNGGVQTPKDAQQLAAAYHRIVSAMKISTDHRLKLEREFEEKTDEAIDRVATEAGLTADRAAQIRREVLGVRQPADKAA
ncbi:DUF3486 family protein [Kaistia dalseonensis]|uniref:Uncharacterized protein n=1 Tax=Kaistia dalseonensis TaxID=410840 RepID=A0ABU0HCC2_9HYPH|nr:phage protein Gp27 family protein [Kaistia dalseonensis]MCX5497314.1 DUF3486 family protein [Kaistia dalseonensis]MDQ0439951.1 hypothetical protein [Kaistia dalseonensis]